MFADILIKYLLEVAWITHKYLKREESQTNVATVIKDAIVIKIIVIEVE